MKISYASLTNPGPRSINEDYLECWHTKTNEFVACVADGLGGMGGGDVASKLAVTVFRKYLDEHDIGSQPMADAALKAHIAIIEAQESGSHSRMASTLTAVAIFEKSLVGVHCGDSRLAIIRKNGIKRLTKDHSEGQRLLEAGKLSKEDFLSYPRRHILESALGGRDYPQIDTFTFDFKIGDRLLLTTDGVHNVMLLRQMLNLTSVSKSPDYLISAVATEMNLRGPTDNYSLVAIFAD
jgi:PPM family protein phosphatase